MPNQYVLPAAALVSLAGAGLGVWLGNASIAEINPIHFAAQQERSRFYADLTPQGYGDWSAVQASEYRAAQSGYDLGTGCVGCRTYPEEVVPVHAASLGKSATAWVEVVEAEVAAAAEPVPAPEPDPAIQQVELYAAFPVTEEEQAGRLVMAEAPAVAEAPAPPVAAEDVTAD